MNPIKIRIYSARQPIAGAIAIPCDRPWDITHESLFGLIPLSDFLNQRGFVGRIGEGQGLRRQQVPPKWQGTKGKETQDNYRPETLIRQGQLIQQGIKDGDGKKKNPRGQNDKMVFPVDSRALFAEIRLAE